MTLSSWSKYKHYESRRYIERLTGYFVPPHTADYTFYVAADEYIEFSLSTSSAKADLSVLAKTTKSGELARKYNDAQRAGENIISMPVSLEANKPYFMQVLHLENSRRNYFSVAMSHTAPAAAPVPLYTTPLMVTLGLSAKVVREDWTLVLTNPSAGKFKLIMGCNRSQPFERNLFAHPNLADSSCQPLVKVLIITLA